MSESQEQDRSEKPTPFKLEQARKKGAVARGMDLAFMSSLAAVLAGMLVLGDDLFNGLATMMRRSVSAAATIGEGPGQLLTLSGHLTGLFLQPLALLFGGIFLVVLALELVQTGFVFSTEPLRPDFGKLSPAKGFKKVFSVRTLIETVKNIVKFGAYFGCAYLVARWTFLENGQIIGDAAALAAAAKDASWRLLGAFLIVAAAFAALDQIIARREFLRQMRMSRREVKREVRDREGEPRMKQRRKQLHAAFVKVSESLRNIRGADVLVTNPVHYAVALRYRPGTMNAPRVVAKGSHALAQRLKRLAITYSVTIVVDPPLARALYSHQLNQDVGSDHFAAVAAIYRRLKPEIVRS